MKKIIYGFLVIVMLFIIVGCSDKEQNINNQEKTKYTQVENSNQDNNIQDDVGDYEEIRSVKIYINNKEYTINLENNETAKTFTNLLPQEFSMSELNGNEKYIYLDNTLPTNSANPKHINAGDVMLYGNNCLVIFYKSFDTSYSYTKIGHIDNLPNLGNGSIEVKIEK